MKRALALPTEQQRNAIANIRKEGIFKKNLINIKTETPLERERQSDKGGGKICTSCKALLSSGYMWRHKKGCAAQQHLDPVSLPIVSIAPSTITSIANIENMDEFTSEVLVRFRDDEIGNLCRTDEALRIIGKDLWDKNVRSDRKPVMTAMRRMSLLILECRKKIADFSGEDLFVPNNYDVITACMKNVTEPSKDSETKDTLKIALAYLLKNSAPVMKASYLIKRDHFKATEVDDFITIVTVKWKTITNKASYNVQIRSEERLRLPDQLPLESDITLTFDYMRETVTTLIEQDTSDFIKLRDLLVAWLTLHNARRGNEVAKMTLEQWKRAEEGAWVNQQQGMTEDERARPVDSAVTYTAGKKKGLVPCLFPNETRESIRKLVSLRSASGIHPLNTYLFPATQQSMDHVLGTQAIQKVSTEAGITGKLTATRNRHRAATLFVRQSPDVVNAGKVPFGQHIAHSEQMSLAHYQTPDYWNEVHTIAPFFDRINSKCLHIYVYITS